MSDWQPMETAPKDGTEVVVVGHIFQGWDKDGKPHTSTRLYGCISAYYDDESKSPARDIGWSFVAPGYCTTITPILWTPLTEAEISSVGG